MAREDVDRARGAVAALADAGCPDQQMTDALNALEASVRLLQVEETITLLREMDRTQQETDESGGREVAWYYFREQFEDALGLDRGALDTDMGATP